MSSLLHLVGFRSVYVPLFFPPPPSSSPLCFRNERGEVFSVHFILIRLKSFFLFLGLPWKAKKRPFFLHLTYSFSLLPKKLSFRLFSPPSIFFWMLPMTTPPFFFFRVLVLSIFSCPFPLIPDLSFSTIPSS